VVGQSTEVKKAIEGYFRDPLGRGDALGNSVLSGQGAGAGGARGVGEGQRPKEDLNALGKRLQLQLEHSEKLKQLLGNVSITVTPEGLRIELMEDSAGTFFESGRGAPSANGQEVLGLVGRELSYISNDVLIEGHTDAIPYAGSGQYSNWELSTDRANAARRILEDQGLADPRVAQVRGWADRQPRSGIDPSSPRNRRVTITVLDDQTGPAADSTMALKPTTSDTLGAQ
jgi:chemotaxis protein MotB